MAVVEEIDHGAVRGLRAGRFTSRMNTTCVFYQIGNTLIDCGPPNQRRFVLDFVEKHSPAQLVFTHHHEDHSGNGADIQERFSLPLFADAAGIHYYENGYPIQMYRRIIWGKPRKFRPQPFPTSLSAGGNLSLIPVPAPGHSPDMTCFLEPQNGWLFTGDLFITSRPLYLRMEENPQQEIESLKRILRLDFDTLFCAHRGIVENGKEALRCKLNYLESLREQVAELTRQGFSREAITAKLLGRENLMSWLTGFRFSKKNMIKRLSPAR